MKSIRKLIQNRKEEERKHKTELVALRKQLPLRHLIVTAENVVKFSWDHWFCLDSLDASLERCQSRFFQAMQHFKTISHASQFEQWVLIHLSKEDLSAGHPPLKYFVDKIRTMGYAEQTVERLTKIQELELTFRESFQKVKKNTSSYSTIGKSLIESMFLKSLKGFGDTPTLALGFNMDFESMKPILQTVAISNSMLALLQRDPIEFMMECLRTRCIPEIFTNYGFLGWNQNHMDMVEKILRSILENGNAPKFSAGMNPPTISQRELIDSNENRIVVEIESGIQIPVLASFKVNRIISRDEFHIGSSKRVPLPIEYEKAVSKVVYSYEGQNQYVRRHTAGYRETNV